MKACIDVYCWIRVEYQFPDFSRYRAVISANGNVLWEPAGVFETSCKIDITFYPYDTQVSRVAYNIQILAVDIYCRKYNDRCED